MSNGNRLPPNPQAGGSTETRILPLGTSQKRAWTITSDEQQALDYHLGCCSQCAKTAKEQEILASWLRAAFYPREHDVNTSSIPAMFLPIGHYASALPVCG